MAQQFGLNAFRAQVAVAPKRQNQFLVVRGDFRLGRFVRGAATFVQSAFAVSLESLPPLSQRRSRDAAAATDETGIIGCLVKLDPLQTGASS